jgi:hypothetical protein
LLLSFCWLVAVILLVAVVAIGGGAVVLLVGCFSGFLSPLPGGCHYSGKQAIKKAEADYKIITNDLKIRSSKFEDSINKFNKYQRQLS